MKMRVKVTPNSKIEGISKEGDLLLVRVKDPPKEGKANRAVVKLLAEYFGVSQGQVTIVSGYNGRNKIIEISGRV